LDFADFGFNASFSNEVLTVGDYTKLIVDADVKGELNILEQKVDELGLCTSGYHSEGLVKQITPALNQRFFNLVLVGQTKYGRGQEEFLQWLSLHVVKGSGPDEIWAFQISEYCSEPRIWTKAHIRLFQL